MGRPPTPVGTFGRIKTEELPPAKNGAKRFRASTYLRMADGTSQRVRRQGGSRNKAEARLKRALSTLADEIKGGEIDGTTRFRRVSELWRDELRQQVALGTLASGTLRTYEATLRNWVVPALGELQMCEVRVSSCDSLVKRARDRVSYDTAKTVRAVVGGVCGYAARHGAIQVNPVRSIGRLSRGEAKEVTALTFEQRVDLLTKLREFGPTRQQDAHGRSLGQRGQIWLDLPEVMEAMLATGVRLGELLALDGADIDPHASTVHVSHHIVRVPGEGLKRVPNRKGNRDGLILSVPQWSLPMWRRRKLAAGEGPLFASFTGGFLDPSNVINRISEAMEAVNYGWVTSHVFRKTVGTVLDEAGLPTTAIADQLGNTRAVAEQHYRKPRKANEASADALEGILRRAR